MFIKLIILVFMARKLVDAIPINNSSFLNNKIHRSLAKRALSYIANETVCVIDDIIYQNGDSILSDDPCESCKCRPPGFACVLRECEVKPGCKEIPVQNECCPSYQCGCYSDGKMYNDGEIVPNPNKILKCYRCKCTGRSIICSLINCHYRLDCESRYEEGECCPNYDHCYNEQIKSIAKNASENQIFDTSITTNRPETFFKFTTSKANTLTDFLPPDQITTISSKLSEIYLPESNNSKKPENESNNDGTNNSLDDSNQNKIKQLTKNNDIKLTTQNITLSTEESSIMNEEAISNINNLDKVTESPSISSNEVTFLISNQVNQMEKRVDNFIDIKNEDIKEKNNLSEELTQPTTVMPDSIKITNPNNFQPFQTLTTMKSLVENNLPSSTTIPNITDTTILAPNTSSIVSFITQSPIINSMTDESKDNNSKKIDETIGLDFNKKNNDLKEFSKNESIGISKDELDLEIIDEENAVKKLEEKLEEKSLDDKVKLDIEESENTGISFKLLKKVLDNCSDNKCNSMEKLIKVTEDVLGDLDAKLIKKIKLSEAFDQLKIKLIANNSTISTDNPLFINSTESEIELEDNYPTTIRYVRTSDLVAEHKDLDSDELELDDKISNF